MPSRNQNLQIAVICNFVLFPLGVQFGRLHMQNRHMKHGDMCFLKYFAFLVFEKTAFFAVKIARENSPQKYILSAEVTSDDFCVLKKYNFWIFFLRHFILTSSPSKNNIFRATSMATPQNHRIRPFWGSCRHGYKADLAFCRL